MANFFNFYINFIKAKQYDSIQKINDKLCMQNEELIGKIEFNHAEYKSEFKNFSSILGSKNAEIIALKEEIEINLSFYKETIDNLSHTVSEKDKEIQSLKDKLQKRDPKTGKFVKKK